MGLYLPPSSFNLDIKLKPTEQQCNLYCVLQRSRIDPPPPPIYSWKSLFVCTLHIITNVTSGQVASFARDCSRHFKPKAFLSLVTSTISLRLMFNQFWMSSIHNVRSLPLAFLPSILPSSARDSILSLHMM